jgi:hypothetical protein
MTAYLFEIILGDTQETKVLLMKKRRAKKFVAESMNVHIYGSFHDRPIRLVPPENGLVE